MQLANEEFNKIFNGIVILTEKIEKKLLGKHKVYEFDLYDALEDELIVVTKGQKKQQATKGQIYEIYGKTSNGRILFIVGLLFADGNLYIITSYWANNKMINFYEEESEGGI